MKCSNCGTENPKGVDICYNCGTKLGKGKVAPKKDEKKKGK